MVRPVTSVMHLCIARQSITERQQWTPSLDIRQRHQMAAVWQISKVYGASAQHCTSCREALPDTHNAQHSSHSLCLGSNCLDPLMRALQPNPEIPAQPLSVLSASQPSISRCIRPSRHSSTRRRDSHSGRPKGSVCRCCPFSILLCLGYQFCKVLAVGIALKPGGCGQRRCCRQDGQAQLVGGGAPAVQGQGVLLTHTRLPDPLQSLHPARQTFSAS